MSGALHSIRVSECTAAGSGVTTEHRLPRFAECSPPRAPGCVRLRACTTCSIIYSTAVRHRAAGEEWGVTYSDKAMCLSLAFILARSLALLLWQRV